LDEGQQKAYDRAIDEFFIRARSNGKTLDLGDKGSLLDNKESDIYKLIESMSAKPLVKEMVIDALKDMAINSPATKLNLTSTLLKGSKSKSDFIKDVESDPVRYNLFAAGDLENLDEQLLNRITADNNQFDINDYNRVHRI
jgi:hypothetical protein